MSKYRRLVPQVMAVEFPILEYVIGLGWGTFIELLLRVSDEKAELLAADLQAPLPATKLVLLELVNLSKVHSALSHAAIQTPAAKLKRLLFLD